MKTDEFEPTLMCSSSMACDDRLKKIISLEKENEALIARVAELERDKARLMRVCGGVVTWLNQTHVEFGDEGAIAERDNLVAAMKGSQ